MNQNMWYGDNGAMGGCNMNNNNNNIIMVMDNK